MAKSAKGKSQSGISSVEIENSGETGETSGSRPTQEQIAVRAYHIYLERGTDGDPEGDWLQAERELSLVIE